MTVAYLANQFPCVVEPYVNEEIAELRRRGIRVIAGSVRRPHIGEGASDPDIILQSAGLFILLKALWLCLVKWKRISRLVRRVLFQGTENPLMRGKALLHTCIGASYAVLLQEQQVDHIHAHHGYFGSWIAMVAARLLGIGFSLTLHGSDLLLHASYLDLKLEECDFCLTVSEFNRRYIFANFPTIRADKVVVARLGVELGTSRNHVPAQGSRLRLLAVGRLHAVKDHAFLVRACKELVTCNVDLECLIAGDGPERRGLENLIRDSGLEGCVKLLGHVDRERLRSFYDWADVVVLTSRSEGIPLVLMEAMARRRIVLAPDITGIPELVIPGKTGFLYKSGSMAAFVDRLLFIHSLLIEPSDSAGSGSCLASAARQLDWIRHAARVHVLQNFNRKKNLACFADLFLARITSREESVSDANLILQQI